MRFSDRKGITVPNTTFQKESMSPELRNSLWNALDLFIWSKHVSEGKDTAVMGDFSKLLWMFHFKQPIDGRPTDYYGQDAAVLREIRTRFFSYEWWEVYNFLEFVLRHFKDDKLNTFINYILSKEFAGYRFVSGKIADLTCDEEINEVEAALSDKQFPGVQTHLSSALALFSNRQNPDYRNSIKESISAVESMAQFVSGDSKATLGKALDSIEKTKNLHGALRAAFEKLYGYTSDDDGIRHGMLEISSLGPEDARFFLVACSAFVNYLKSKIC